MIECGVCAFFGLNGEAEEPCEQDVVESELMHFCCECGRHIDKGRKHEYSYGFSEGERWEMRTCIICAEIREAFCCDGYVFGDLWKAMEEVSSQMNISCLDRLSTPEAKAELQRRWMVWKGL